MEKSPLTIAKVTGIIMRKIMPVIEIVMIPIAFLGALWLKHTRKQMFSGKFRITRKLLKNIGVYPIIDHYYEPVFNYNSNISNWDKIRELPNFNINIDGQLELISNFNYASELIQIPIERIYTNDYFYKNSNFEAGDSEFYYSLIRKEKPKKIIEIGSGNSTLIALKAILANKSNDESDTELVCIEPYPSFWLKKVKGIKLIQSKVEDVAVSLFEELEAGDILFIDSTHMIKPEGDVLFEFFQILPRLKKGVYIHVHDIFTPYHFPKTWIEHADYLWNEQFLLESILCNSDQYITIGSLYYLKQRHMEQIKNALPMLNKLGNNPGSYWIKKIN